MLRLWSKIKNFFSPPPAKVLTGEYEIHRLSAEAFAQLELRLTKPGLPRNVEEAAYMVGIQVVLSELRKGFVVG